MDDFDWKAGNKRTLTGPILEASINGRQIKIGQNVDRTFWWSEDYVIAFNGYLDVKHAKKDAFLWIESGKRPANVKHTRLAGWKD